MKRAIKMAVTQLTSFLAACGLSKSCSSISKEVPISWSLSSIKPYV